MDKWILILTYPATESGVDASVESRFPGANVVYGSAASGAGGNRECVPSLSPFPSMLLLFLPPCSCYSSFLLSFHPPSSLPSLSEEAENDEAENEEAKRNANHENRIPPQEGGTITSSGQPTKARDFEGVGGPADKAVLEASERGGEDGVQGNVR